MKVALGKKILERRCKEFLFLFLMLSLPAPFPLKIPFLLEFICLELDL